MSKISKGSVLITLMASYMFAVISVPARLFKSVNSMRVFSQSRLLDVIAENALCSVRDRLIADSDNSKASQYSPRQILNAHYCNVIPEPCTKPYLISASSSCAEMLHIPTESLSSTDFLQIFSGNKLVPGLDSPFAMNYGCHSYGTWFGQLGDGRAISLGELQIPDTELTYELQLKGSGRTPFSRSFDGRAVVRSSIREYLASEAMFHLHVPTTRALSVLGTGDVVLRPWYATTSEETSSDELKRRPVSGKYPPNTMKSEPGAIVCRVAQSFLRFGHLELFAIRKEYNELLQLADFVCYREFPTLLNLPIPERYIDLYRNIVRTNAELVVEWLRVGYVQGNMNSDNTCLNGRTIDYGPFAFMEAFDPKYQPFTSDRDGKFAYIFQPSAMQVNVNILGERAFVELIRQGLKLAKPGHSEDEVNTYITQIYNIANEEFPAIFWNAYSTMKKRKLGIKNYSEAIPEDTQWWTNLEKLMQNSECDYTIFFRELCTAAGCASPEDAFRVITTSFNIDNLDEDARKEWIEWLTSYLRRIKNEQGLWESDEERKATQLQANPKYILRNWMAIMAYESAEKGDFSIVHEIARVLADPYALDEDISVKEEQERESKWYKKTPTWAQDMPGCTFMSCSS